MAIQFKVFGDIFKNYLGISDKYTIFLAGTIVVMYSAFGGIKSVAFTDVIQFFTFGVLVPVLSILLWNSFTSSGDAGFHNSFG
jgi:Na+/proline symporter